MKAFFLCDIIKKGDYMKQKIGILDSGIGGTSTLEEIKKLLPNEDYIYYADSKNNPYGEKTPEEIYKIVKNIVEFLIAKNTKLIVLACNTATTRCLKKLKVEYPNMLFVGTVPAIKVACDNNFKHTLVLATPSTIDSERTKELIKDNKRIDQEITLISCEGLANAIETHNDKKIEEILLSVKEQVQDKNIDSIVLGCTHYSLIKDKINEIFKDVTLLDGNYGVAKEVKHQLLINNLLNKEGHGKVDFIKS